MAKGRRTDFSEARCPIARSLGAVGDPWSLLIVREALRGGRRFNEFQLRLGLAKNILAARLRRLVAEGVLEIVAAERGGARSEYRLTAKGEALRVVLVALAAWGRDHAFDPDENPPTLVERDTGRLVLGLVGEGDDGRRLAIDEMMVAPARDPR